ncbi:MAG: efflux RND transporter periplasmic adaptor subunit [Candidatus Solibacter usitatus]|nr:efflux RND transporter periplasmic adaptor subunit [Candidatus Solibacter usitatus]
MSQHRFLFLVLTAGACFAQSVEVATVTSKVLERKTKLPGEFTPYQTVDLSARVPGYVEKVDGDVGTMVKAGQTLVTLSAPEMQAQISESLVRVQVIDSQKAEAQARLVAAQSTYERIKAASATPGAIAANELTIAEKTVDAAQALIRSLENSAKAAQGVVAVQRDLIGYLKVTAPFDGVITQRWAHPGALAGPNAKPLLRLEQQSRLRLIVAVPETDAGGVQLGAKVPFTVPAFPGETFHGVVARMPHNMDAKTRTMPVEMDVMNSNGRLTPGMYPEVQWPFRRARPSMLVPRTSIVTTTERSFVVRLNHGKAEWVNLVRGSAAGDLVEVFANLSAGDTIVKSASDEIREGSAITAKK